MTPRAKRFTEMKKTMTNDEIAAHEDISRAAVIGVLWRAKNDAHCKAYWKNYNNKMYRSV